MDEAVKQNVDLELEESSGKMWQIEGFWGYGYWRRVLELFSY